MSENNQLKDELNPTSPPEGLVTRIWQTRPLLKPPPSIPNDLETKEITEIRKDDDRRDPDPAPA
jgi:hypothetical protein